MFRTVLIVVLLVAVMALLGWIRFYSDDDSASVIIDREAIRQDARETWESGRETLDRSRRRLEERSEDQPPAEADPIGSDEEALTDETLTDQPST